MLLNIPIFIALDKNIYLAADYGEDSTTDWKAGDFFCINLMLTSESVTSLAPTVSQPFPFAGQIVWWDRSLDENYWDVILLSQWETMSEDSI